jgi:serine/threonine-protein kinase CHEK2
MLTVDVEKRYTIEDCLEHPWTTQKAINVNDSTDGLVGGIANLDFTKRKIARERTLLSSLNDVKVSKVIDIQNDKVPVRVYVKNPNGKSSQNKVNKSKTATGINDAPNSIPAAAKEEDPSQNRRTKEFMALGGKGDQELYGNEDSVYAPNEIEEAGE